MTQVFLDTPGQWVRAAAKANPKFTKNRYYEDGSKAIANGHRPGDPRETIRLLYRSMNDQIIYRKLNDHLRPLFHEISDRLDEDILRTLRSSSEEAILRDIIAIPKAAL